MEKRNERERATCASHVLWDLIIKSYLDDRHLSIAEKTLWSTNMSST